MIDRGSLNLVLATSASFHVVLYGFSSLRRRARVKCYLTTGRRLAEDASACSMDAPELESPNLRMSCVSRDMVLNEMFTSRRGQTGERLDHCAVHATDTVLMYDRIMTEAVPAADELLRSFTLLGASKSH
ncbi:hypothetical protein EVAR_80157_1 [Eumeta japonica]|uniref:Uncharacterized protein n=1 Tax=Eumeta variegata TaxID=151549 RepID=A0A4C1Y7C6_EUMVA|nr:hypothetical protein EVAR_80157_1 [Eumeta japonica]